MISTPHLPTGESGGSQDSSLPNSQPVPNCISFLSDAWDHLPEQHAQPERHELDLYCQERRTDNTDRREPLRFWKDIEAKYPRLAEMSREILTMPGMSIPTYWASSPQIGRLLTFLVFVGSSVGVERVFWAGETLSESGDTCWMQERFIDSQNSW